MKRSEDTNEISKAFASAQAEMKNPALDSSNPHFNSKFASLAAIRNTVVPAFAKHGLSIMQEITPGVMSFSKDPQDNGAMMPGVNVLTIVQHTSGQWFEFGPTFMPTSKENAQGFGSASTYARRYAMQAIAAIVGDEDDDAAAAEPALKRQRPAKPKAELDPDVAIAIRETESVEALRKLYAGLSEEQREAALPAMTKRSAELKGA
jgi:hypothetical protein